MSLYIMSKNVWGPPTWQLLHCMSIKAKDIMTPIQIKQLMVLIERVASNLPCPTCSSHAKSYFKQHHYNQLTTLPQLRHFLFTFHNNVNLRLKKSVITYEEHNIIYQNMSMEVVLKNMFQVYQNMNSANVTMMLYSFHRNSILKDLDQYFVSNHSLFVL